MGARESNAGDDFHFWWAASRALALIEPGTNSQLLTIEGLSRVDDSGEEYAAVDVAEYFGGDDLASADAVVLSQLKYSTRQPDKAWTVGRICERRTRRYAAGGSAPPRSVVGDLAGVYARLLEERSRDELLAKVRINLVSNQPGDSLLQESVVAASEWVRSQEGPTKRATLFKGLAEPYAGVIAKLAAAIGSRLRSSDFCDFLTVLNLSQTGSLARAALARGVQAAAAELMSDRGPDSARRLFDLVRREALPESSRMGIRAEDVLAKLGVGDLRDLYPAPVRLPTIPDPLPTPGSSTIAEAVLANPGGIVVAHGEAGAGKSTALQQLQPHLPSGSAVALFDCYGGGEYLNSGEERHTPWRFVTQIVNDLAQQCGTSLLIEPPTTEEDLWRRLTRALDHAVGTLDEGAVLVLAVDAADNAAYAADERGQRGFLTGLVRLALPSRVTVVLTAQSHRRFSLKASGSPQVKIPQFDSHTSTAHLRRYRPEASDAEAGEFHARTGGNPRVQFYVLSQADTHGWDMPSLLAACVLTPEPLFGALVESALQVSGGDAGGQRWLALMLALARPIRTATLATALTVDQDAVIAFGHGLHPGVEVVGEEIKFRDENFETYVRDRVEREEVVAAHDLLADMFLGSRASDPEAAAHVVDHLFQAGRFDEVLELVLKEQSPAAIPDGFRRAEVQAGRLDLAARAAAHTGSPSAAVRFAVRAAETATQVDTLSSLAESHLDLVARYADADRVRAHVLREHRKPWLAPIQMRLAAALARSPERHEAAREALDAADAWLHRWMTSAEEETRGWRIDEQDVACAAEARYRVEGPEAAIGELRRWRPAQFALNAATTLAARLAPELGPQPVRDALRAHNVPLVAQARFLAHAASPEQPPEHEWIDEVVDAALAVEPGEAKSWHDRLLDVAARHGDPDAAAALARHWARELPAHRWAFCSGDALGVAELRSRALSAALQGDDLDTDDLLPASLRPPQEDGRAEDPRAQDRREWTQTVSPLLAAAQLAARAALGSADPEEFATLVAEGLARRTQAAEHRWFTFDGTYRAWAAIVVEAVVDTGTSSDVLDQLADAAPALLRDGAPALWLDLAAAVSRRGAYRDRAADLCARAARQVTADAYPAPDRLDLLARASDIAAGIAPELGQQLFDQVVDAASGINDDAARLLTVHADLAAKAATSELDRPSVASQLVDAAESVAPFVTETGVVPYAALVCAAGRLDAGVALAAASRWDDEDRIRLTWTLPAALLGAVDGGGVSVEQALLLDHLIADDRGRLEYRLAVLDRLEPGAANRAVKRLALNRTASWLRCDASACNQPALAQQLLDWAAARGLDEHIRSSLDPVACLGRDDVDTGQRWRGADPSADAQALLENPQTQSWETLATDVAVLEQGRVYGDQMRDFVAAVALAAPTEERVHALAEVADLPAGLAGGACAVVSVLAECLTCWRDWPGIADWATSALPQLLAQHLRALVVRQDIDTLIDQLRAFDDDDAIRRAVLLALPDVRPRLGSFAWQNVASLLGRLCGPREAADAVASLLRERVTDDDAPPPLPAPTGVAGPVPLLLWSAFGHPRRELRWRAAHATRELLGQLDLATSQEVASALVACLDHADTGAFRDPSLHFYRMSAAAALLMALQRVAAERPEALDPHLAAFVRHATSCDFPHAQIRELARQTALTLANPTDPAVEELRWANQPAACLTDRTFRPRDDDRRVSDDWRYRFDPMDTLPYWYAPLADVFDLPVDAVAQRAERWILDEWGLDEDDWMGDPRVLRDQRSFERMSHRHGIIPPEENLCLYLEYHAMMVAAGELIDERRPVRVSQYDDADDSWHDWLSEHLPRSTDTWLADLRHSLPAEPPLFDPQPDERDAPGDDEYDNALRLVDGRLPDPVLVAAHTSLTHPHRGASSSTYIWSALVAPAHAPPLQRALAAATNPTDWKLPDEDEAKFEVHHDGFVLCGWLADRQDRREGLDKHDPYAHDLSLALPMPGDRFRRITNAAPDPTGLKLYAPDGTVIAHAEQWADRDDAYDTWLSSAGHRIHVAREPLLRLLAETAMTLIVEVQIGRHRRSAGPDDYRPPRSRIYLVDAAGGVTVR